MLVFYMMLPALISLLMAVCIRVFENHTQRETSAL